MSEKPWHQAEPGQPITASAWNGWQIELRKALAAHDHSGGELGAQLTGDSFDPTTDLKVQAVHLSDTAVVNGVDLRKKAAETAAAAAKLLEPEIAKALPGIGGTLAGNYAVKGDVGAGSVQVGGKLTVGGKRIEPTRARIAFEHRTNEQNPNWDQIRSELDETSTQAASWGRRTPVRLTRRSLVLFMMTSRQLGAQEMYRRINQRVGIAGQGKVLSLSPVFRIDAYGNSALLTDWETRAAHPQSASQQSPPTDLFSCVVPAGDWEIAIRMFTPPGSSNSRDEQCAVLILPYEEAPRG